MEMISAYMGKEVFFSADSPEHKDRQEALSWH